MKQVAKRIAKLNASSFLKNPLEWKYIDRTIFLAVNSLLLPLLYGGVIAFALYLQLTNPEAAPVAINENIVYWYLFIYGFQYLLLNVFIIRAVMIRKKISEWPLFWTVVSYSWVICVLIPSFMVGTYYIDGVLLLLLGFTLSLPLQNHLVLVRCFVLAAVIFLLMAVLDVTGTVPHAPLFASPPYINDKLWVPWHYSRLLMGGVCFCMALVIAKITIYWKKRESIYQEMSNKDGLTGLASRNYFMRRLETEFLKVQSRRGDLSLIMIDLDFFKKVNDAYGHLVGDHVLEETAKILMRNARKYDEVGRCGGEEFAILLPNTSLDIAVKIAERIRNNFSETEMQIEDGAFRITASLGVASYPDLEIKNINDLFRKADVALYNAKNEGRNQVVAAEQSVLKSVNQ